jgi:prepilin-type N-terminal cleavage/methylation domain-containing protein
MEPKMTSAASATSDNNAATAAPSKGRRASRARRGFTLVELLVVMGIIILLAGLLFPMVMRAMRQGVRARTQADLNAIATALEAYKGDFGDYPRANGNGAGFAVLAQALLGPGPAAAGVNEPNPAPQSATNLSATPTSTIAAGNVIEVANTGTTPTTYTDYVAIATGTFGQAGFGTPPAINYVQMYPDGADGAGFRIRGTTGQVYGPYLKADNWKQVDTSGNLTCALLDRSGSPILYFPARRPAPNISVQTATDQGYVGDSHALNTTHPLYDFGDNWGVFATANGLHHMRIMLGDYGQNGAIDAQAGLSSETAATTAPFILWAAGPDKVFGVDTSTSTYGTGTLAFATTVPNAQRFNINKNAVRNSDDVTNFTFSP